MKLTKLALALAAVLAMAALMASAASALQYKSGATPVNISGAQSNTHTFAVDGQNVTCTNATFNKNGLATPANEVPGVVAAYGNCTVFGLSGSVNMGTCTFNFDNPNAGLNSTFDIACTSNANVNGNATNNGDMRIVAQLNNPNDPNNPFLLCEVHIESQNNLGTLTFMNDTPLAGRVRVGAGVSNLTAQKTLDGLACPLSGANTVNNATFNGNTDLAGGGGVNLEVS